MDNPNLKLIKKVSWDEVFSMWGKGESDLPHWIEHYKDRGFASWQDWRKDSVKDLHLENLSWNLYEIISPAATVSEFHAGPFRAWIKKYYRGEQTVFFGQLAKEPEIQSDAIINEIINNFPEDSILVGLENKGNIVIIEGVHRGCALAVAQEKGIRLSPRIFIAVASFSGDIPLLGQENSPT